MRTRGDCRRDEGCRLWWGNLFKTPNPPTAIKTRMKSMTHNMSEAYSIFEAKHRGLRLALNHHAGGKIQKQQQKCESSAVDRLPQPLHGELDILRLQVSPALDHGLVAVFGEA